MIEFNSVSKIYHMGEEEIKAIDNISFEIPDDKFTVILGPSGSGKSTTLNLLGGMDTATSGKILLDGEDITKLSEKGLQLIPQHRQIPPKH
ncbi:ATP-binding cassette domain-containing protein [uncultured Ruminococcus sp.]|uniref:ATP-binding cassette domain-containing protein n=1 Tax=uncultured Ruminococcus sp. TaxID=165186 RepID=UPI00260ABC6A|nr:ATP-binding cassette domain-containing protein [uncultured Ruminococcus sp.]